MAEREGFEPSVACTTHDFQSCTFSHSVTSPRPVRNAHNVAFVRETPIPSRTHGGGEAQCAGKYTFAGSDDLSTASRYLRNVSASGERGIRTLGGVAPTPDFESGSFGLSDTSPVRHSHYLRGGENTQRRSVAKNERRSSAQRASSIPLRTDTL